MKWRRHFVDLKAVADLLSNLLYIQQGHIQLDTDTNCINSMAGVLGLVLAACRTWHAYLKICYFYILSFGDIRKLWDLTLWIDFRHEWQYARGLSLFVWCILRSLAICCFLSMLQSCVCFGRATALRVDGMEQFLSLHVIKNLWRRSDWWQGNPAICLVLYPGTS